MISLDPNLNVKTTELSEPTKLGAVAVLGCSLASWREKQLAEIRPK